MTGKCYDHNKKNQRIVEWVRCEERMPEEGRLCAIVGDLGHGLFKTFANWKGYYWKDDEDGQYCFARGHVKWWCYWPELPEGGE